MSEQLEDLCQKLLPICKDRLKEKDGTSSRKESSVDNSSSSHCVRKDIVHKDDHEEEKLCRLGGNKYRVTHTDENEECGDHTLI